MTHGHRGAGEPAPVLDVPRIRRQFAFPATGRVVTNNAASTQPPRVLLDLFRSLAPWYENVHRGQSWASQRMTGMFEERRPAAPTVARARCAALFGQPRGVLAAVMTTARTPRGRGFRT